MSADRLILESTLGAGALIERPHLFSDSIIELPASELVVLSSFVQAVTRLIGIPSYQNAIAARNHLKMSPQPPGVCLGFDFHRTPSGPRLIEINTNAGGSLLVTLLNRAWGLQETADIAEQALLDMFLSEWQAWSPTQGLKTIAIVDDNPEQQYLYPEFVRWQKLFEAHGIQAMICGPEVLDCDADGRLHAHGQSIDLLYNRLTDFSLSTPELSSIAQSWVRQVSGSRAGTLITPNPVAHALWADKRNLDWLSDAERLRSFDLDADSVEQIVACVPRTVPVFAAEAEDFWNRRKSLFFKPQAGFGSRATYRGDKLTKRVFEEILQGGYVAQDFVPPPEVRVSGVADNAEPTMLKYDLRVYAYNGKIQLLAGRLYQGQTTNFRTSGGGFAPVRISG